VVLAAAFRAEDVSILRWFVVPAPERILQPSKHIHTLTLLEKFDRAGAPVRHKLEDLQRGQMRSPDQALEKSLLQRRHARIFGVSMASRSRRFAFVGEPVVMKAYSFCCQAGGDPPLSWR
jgi:hypothetical protein